MSLHLYVLLGHFLGGGLFFSVHLFLLSLLNRIIRSSSGSRSSSILEACLNSSDRGVCGFGWMEN